MTANLFDLTGRVAAVTGAASGLGRAMAIGLANYGSRIAVMDTDKAGTLATVETIRKMGGDAVAITFDVSREDEVSAAFVELDHVLGAPDILVNNAGIGSHKRPEDLSVHEWRSVIAVNLTGYFLCAQQAGRRMIDRRRGSIVNISSIGGASALGRGNFVYDISKAGVLQLTRELAVEWAQHGIRVNAILPCQIRTPALQKLIDDPAFDSNSLIARILTGIPLNRIGEPEDLVGAVVFLVSDAAAMVTGALLPVDGGNLALNAGGSSVW